MDRLEYWSDFIRSNKIKVMAEIGVWKGDFAQAILSTCPDIEAYYLIDPWQMLDDWNKPLNEDDLEAAFEETKAKIAPYADKTVILRGRTTEVADQLPELDFAYIDGDHTLRGIVLDMMRVWPKIKPECWLAGDDFSPSIWQHAGKYEPTMVFPFAVHFAEGANAPIKAVNTQQFLMQKVEGFAFDDPEGAYPSRDVRDLFKAGDRTKQTAKYMIRKAMGR